VEDTDRFYRSGEFVWPNEKKLNMAYKFKESTSSPSCFVRFNFIGIEIAIGIEIDPLNSDFDSEPDSDFDYLRVRTIICWVSL